MVLVEMPSILTRIALLSTFVIVRSSKLNVTCAEGNNLVVKIPYPAETSTNLLYFGAGSCESWEVVETNGGSKTYDDVNMLSILTIPIDYCGFKKRNNVNVTYGVNVGETEIIFRNIIISADCGSKSEYRVEFSYNDGGEISAVDHESIEDSDGVNVDGTFIFPAVVDSHKFEIVEYTDKSYETEADETTRAKVSGDIVFLKIRGTLEEGYKFAVQNCSVSSGDQSFEVLKAGTCELDVIQLQGAYVEGDYHLQHRLFLLGGSKIKHNSNFKLSCTVKVCDKTDPGNECNSIVEPCKTDDELNEYMCDGLCQEDEDCNIVDNKPVCSPAALPTSDSCGCTNSIYSADPQCDLDTLSPLCRYIYEYIGIRDLRGFPEKVDAIYFKSTSEEWNPLYSLSSLKDNLGIFAELTNMEWIVTETGYQDHDFPIFVSEHVKHIHVGHSFQILDGEEGKNPDLIEQPLFCPSMAYKEERYKKTTMTAEGFTSETFKYVPNLQSLRLYGMKQVNIWDIGVDYFVKNTPKLEFLDLLNFNVATTECLCGNDPSFELDMGVSNREAIKGYCGNCMTIDFCRQLCGVHPTLEGCRYNAQYSKQLTCDRTNAAHNGTWHDADDDDVAVIESRIEECEQSKADNPLPTI